MKRGILPPLAILGAVLVFALWNGAAMRTDTVRWQGQLCRAEALVRQGNWPAAAEALERSYQDWSGRQTYLHIVTQHSAVHEAEEMYRRAMALAGAQEDSGFFSELAALRAQLRRLSEMELFSVKNVL